MTALGSFIRDTAYFQSRRDQQLMINAEDFDLQFNHLINFINSKISPLTDQLEARVVPGTDDPDTANTFLRNVGDGTTEWVPINNEAVIDYSLGFSKLIQADAGSIFATGNDRIFRIVSPTDDGQILSSTDNDLPVWQKLRGDNFKNRAITGANIDFGCIGLDLLSPDVVGRPLDNNSILARHILNESISGDKLEDFAIITQHIEQGLLDLRRDNINAFRFNIPYRPVHPESSLLQNRHFVDNLFREANLMRRDLTNVDDNLGHYTFTPDNIADESLDIGYFQGNLNNIDIEVARSFAVGAIEPRHIIDHSVQFTAFTGSPQYIGRIRKEKLNYQIRNRLGI